jgi:hypothetical protein
MTEYFAVTDDDGVRSGPFHTIGNASRFLKKVASDRGYSDEEAREFFLRDSAVVMVETVNGKVDFTNVGWLAREKSGRLPAETEDFDRKRDRFASAKESLRVLQIEP